MLATLDADTVFLLGEWKRLIRMKTSVAACRVDPGGAWRLGLGVRARTLCAPLASIRKLSWDSQDKTLESESQGLLVASRGYLTAGDARGDNNNVMTLFLHSVTNSVLTAGLPRVSIRFYSLDELTNRIKISPPSGWSSRAKDASLIADYLFEQKLSRR